MTAKPAEAVVNMVLALTKLPELDANVILVMSVRNNVTC